MKDLALPDHLPALRAAGVSCFKIEGRKKSPLYVATTTDYYRKLLDGTLDRRRAARHRSRFANGLQPAVDAAVRAIAQGQGSRRPRHRRPSRHARSARSRRSAAAAREPRLRFRTGRALERHDGLQIDLPVLGKPFGFAVDQLWIVAPAGKRQDAQEVFEAPAGSLVEVGLPRDHPALPIGAPVYCSSSQAVKQKLSP